jgi:hypothetical protein
MPVYSPTYADAPEREATWYATDPPQPSGFTPPPLLMANGGSWPLIQSRAPKSIQQQNAIYIVRDKGRELRDALGEKEWQHQLAAVLFWPLDSADAETDQTLLDAEITKILARIRGPWLDKTHGGAFASVGEDSNEILVDYGDVIVQIQNGGPLEVHIRYVATDTFPA